MTIAIGINLGLYAILAADTRETVERLGSPFFDDNKSKVHKTTMGLIAGAGLVQLLDAVNAQLASETITSTERISAIVAEEGERVRRQFAKYSKLDWALANTGWIFSYITVLDGNPTLRLGIIHPSIENGRCTLYPIGEPAVIFPVELDKEAVEGLWETFIGRIHVPADDTEVQKSIEQNLKLIARLVFLLQPHCISISRRLQVGIHMDSQAKISEMIDIKDDGSFSLNMKLG